MLEHRSHDTSVPFTGLRPRDAALPPALTGREYEVLALLAVGYPMKQVAHRLGITYRTVTFHKYRMMERLGVRTNAGLMYYALRNGILDREYCAIGEPAATA